MVVSHCAAVHRDHSGSHLGYCTRVLRGISRNQSISELEKDLQKEAACSPGVLGALNNHLQLMLGRYQLNMINRYCKVQSTMIVVSLGIERSCFQQENFCDRNAGNRIRPL